MSVTLVQYPANVGTAEYGVGHGKDSGALASGHSRTAATVGDRPRLAWRRRRRLAAKEPTKRSRMAPMTMRSQERGGAGMTIGTYVAVMRVLNVEKDLNALATLFL